MKVSVPVEGAKVKQGTNYIKTAGGGVEVAEQSPTKAQASTPAPTKTAGELSEQISQAVEAPQAAARPLTPLEQFHPQLGPDKELAWDEKTGKIRITAKAVETNTGVTGEGAEMPEQGGQHATAGQAAAAAMGVETQTAPVREADKTAALESQVAQLTQLVTVMAQAQISGKSIGELLGQPAAPAEPDYSQVDMYDPGQVANMIRDVVRSETQAFRQEFQQQHQATLEGARQRQEYDLTVAKYGHEPNFQNKIAAALEIAQANPQMPVENAYLVVSHIGARIHPEIKAPDTARAATGATRTITAEQAAQKAEQAKRLPGNSGVRGAGQPEMPAHIKGLGNHMAWYLNQADSSN